MAQISIIWDYEARESFKGFLHEIRLDSLQAAESVRLDILSVVSSLTDYPEKFPPDKFKQKNDGCIRAFEKHGCRVSYFFFRIR